MVLISSTRSTLVSPVCAIRPTHSDQCGALVRAWIFLPLIAARTPALTRTETSLALVAWAVSPASVERLAGHPAMLLALQPVNVQHL